MVGQGLANIIGNTLTGSGAIGGGPPPVDPALILKYTTTTPSESIEIKSRTTNNYDVDWGDGSSDTAVTATIKNHTYSAAGTYTVKITGVFPEPDFGNMSTANKNKIVELSNWGEIEYKNFYEAFDSCVNMEYTATDYPDLSTATANTANMFRAMFRNCEGITGSIDLTNWANLSCAGSYGTYQIFDGCDNITGINMSGWNVPNVTFSGNMFKDCGKTSTNGCVFTLANMSFGASSSFQSCFENAKIDTIDISNWTLKSSGTVNLQTFLKLTTTPHANLGALDLSGWTNTSQVNKISQWMWGTKFTSINTTGWDTSLIGDMSYAFYNASLLTDIIGLSGWKGDSITTMRSSFQNCSVLSFATHNFDTTLWGISLTNLNSLLNTFTSCSLTTPSVAPNVTNWDTDSVTSFSATFQKAKFTSALDISSWDFSAATTLSQFMRECTGTTSITFSNISSGCTSLSQSFYLAGDIATIIFDSSCNLSSVTTFNFFAASASTLTTLTFDASVSFAAVTNWASSFTGVTLNTASYDAILIRNDATNSNVVTLAGGNSLYTKATSAAATARAALVTAGWTIQDGGPTP
jgi:surface protein